MRVLWTRDLIIEACHEWTATHGVPPKSDQWSAPPDSRFPSQNTVKKHFGTWNAMIEAAGYASRCPRTFTRYWTDERIVEACRAWVAVHGEPPRANDWRASAADRPSTKTVLHHFGRWNSMLVAAGCSPRDPHGQTKWSKDDIANVMLDWFFRHGKWPTSHDWLVPRPGVNPAHTTVFRRFGSWRAAKRYAGWNGLRQERVVRVPRDCVGCGGGLDGLTKGCRQCRQRARLRRLRAEERAVAA